jgi:hypothetical protein
MKKIANLLLLLFAFVLFFSCSSEEADDITKKIEKEEFVPVTLSFSAKMRMEKVTGENSDIVDTKSGSETYDSDLYLIIPNGNENESLKIDVTNGEFQFDLTTAPNNMLMARLGARTRSFSANSDVYFSSTPATTINAVKSETKKTPKNNDTYELPDKNIFRSKNLDLKASGDGIELFGKTYSPGQENDFVLTMYRQTAKFNVKLVLYYGLGEDLPIGVTDSHLEWAQWFSPRENWEITPYLNKYPLAHSLIGTERGTPDYSNLGVYMLSDGPLELTKDIVNIGYWPHIGETLVAKLTEVPYIFNGSFETGKSTLEFLLTEKRFGQIVKRIAQIQLDGEILPNQEKTLNVCLNIYRIKYENNILRAVSLDDIDILEESPDLFYFWE